jgi:hypothetical protein
MPLPHRIGNHVYSRGALWSFAAFVACREAAIRWAPPDVARRAACELVAVQSVPGREEVAA